MSRKHEFSLWWATPDAPTMRRFNWFSDHSTARAAHTMMGRISLLLKLAGHRNYALVITSDFGKVREIELLCKGTDYSETKGRQYIGEWREDVYTDLCLREWSHNELR